MPDVVLATINARYSHASFGLRYLMANLGELQAVTRMRSSNLRTEVDTSLTGFWRNTEPQIVGLGCLHLERHPDHRTRANKLRARIPIWSSCWADPK
jgi:hypothetical protein